MSSSAPSTATVLEFRCLFTHDLRRKQKRWQDGRLKYHTFNARVMVHDERGNSVGDMHWHGEYDFGEGEEVQLDRGGVIVQVEDLVERRETDLSELVDKRLQEKQQRQIQQLARSTASSAVPRHALPRPPAVAPVHPQPPRHRPLHHVIGTPTGHHGKALVPKESPFEQRQQAAESLDDRTAKRRKYEDPPPSKSGYASALFGQALTLSATPSSSVSAIRRSRPEVRSDPPAETDAQYPQQEPKPARREQLQSSRRLNQRAYAQSLFGQTLTLSHTPVGSVPSRPQARNESVSNTMVDGNIQEPSEAAQRSPSQQLIRPRLLDQPSSNSRLSSGLAKRSADIENSKGSASLSRRHHATNSAHTIPGSIEIIEIDDSEPIAPPAVRQPRTQKTTSASLQNPDEDLDSSNMAVGKRHMSHDDPVRSTRQQSSEPGRRDNPKKAKKPGSHERTRIPETAVSKANGRNTSSGRVDPAAQENMTRASSVTRDPALPVTELRIKSSKKRGLLMISETPQAKKTRRQAPADSARPFEGDLRDHSRGSEDDDPFKSPSPQPPSEYGYGNDVGGPAKKPTTVSRPLLRNGDDDDDLDYPILNRDGQWENEEGVTKLRRKSAQRTFSTELGEDDDPSHSSSLAISEQTCSRPEPATSNNDMQLGHERPERVEATAQNVSDAGLFSGDSGRREAADVVQPSKHSSSPSRARYDPYRIPSSPRASSPEVSLSGQRKGREHDVGVEILRSIDSNKSLSKARTQRHSRRKVISDEDDEDDVEPLASLPRNPDFGSDSELGTVPVLAEEAVNKRLKSRKATSIKTSAQQDIPTIESGDERPKRATRKAKSRHTALGMESEEDELPMMRRQSTRQRRSRATSYEEPSPFPSEQDGSEEEGIPRKRRKTKTSKASEDRPRLEKIKKNVKSRELIGFDLASLNAPLGLRGIGMPFSILPSPVNESIQRRVSSRAAVDDNESPVVVDEGGAQMPLPSPDQPAAPFKTNAQAQQESPSTTSNREPPDHTPPLSKSHITRQSPGENLSGALVGADGSGEPRPSGIVDSGKSDVPEANLQSPSKYKNKQIAEKASSSKQAKKTRQPAPRKPMLEAQQSHAAVPTPRGIAIVAPAEQTVSSLDQSAQNDSRPFSRQSAAVAKHTASGETTLEALTKTVASAQPSPAPAQTSATKPVINTGIILQGQRHGNDQQPPSTIQPTGDKTKAPTNFSVAADQLPNITTKPQAVTSLNQQKPSIQGQPSTLESAQASDTIQSDPSIPTGTPMAPSAVDKPDSGLNRHSLTTGDQDTVAIETTVGNLGSDIASDHPVRQPKVIGLRRQLSARRSINNIGAKSAPQPEMSEASSIDVHSKTASNVRLANPASRGRKAALASHAAGPVPQRMLPPTQPALILPISTADLAMTPIEQAPKEPERPKKKMTFPGFQSARSDGPWSREAFDLLESGRPE